MKDLASLALSPALVFCETSVAASMVWCVCVPRRRRGRVALAAASPPARRRRRVSRRGAERVGVTLASTPSTRRVARSRSRVDAPRALDGVCGASRAARVCRARASRGAISTSRRRDDAVDDAVGASTPSPHDGHR